MELLTLGRKAQQRLMFPLAWEPRGLVVLRQKCLCERDRATYQQGSKQLFVVAFLICQNAVESFTNSQETFVSLVALAQSAQFINGTKKLLSFLLG